MIAMPMTLAVVGAQRAIELVWAQRHVPRLIARGGYEVGASHYPLFFVVHIAWFLGIGFEAGVHGGIASPLWPLWGGLSLLAQGLRYWAIVALGEHWTTRVYVVPGMTLVTRGPFRWMRHPNYVALTTEILCVPLIFNAYWTAFIGSIFSAWLMRERIRVEERALADATAFVAR